MMLRPQVADGIEDLIECGAAVVGILSAAETGSDKSQYAAAAFYAGDLEPLPEPAILSGADNADTGVFQLSDGIECGREAMLQNMIIGEIGYCYAPIGEVFGDFGPGPHLGAPKAHFVAAYVRYRAFDIADGRVVRTDMVDDVAVEEFAAVNGKR
jgi:hypothetical protein